ncbi:transposase [Lactobacillus amylovorus]|uniref:transposase n=1 Tax=Lactobacillus amylovorus TaxID=1604 RepID=UPI00232AAB47|nr:transposase [Lactobacillus amylovorus]MDB6230601.1 transposase [Lactobacillus amylovorus]
MTEQILTVKVRLKPTNKQAEQFDAVSEFYRQACNIVSAWYFDKHFAVARKDFNKDMYYLLKNRYPKLNTAMIQSTYRTVKARYDTVKTQLVKKPYRIWSGKYDDNKRKRYLSIKRDLEWLQKPIMFHRPQADYLRNINYSFTRKYSQISLNVLGKRIKVDYCHNFNNLLFASNSSLGTAKLVNACGHWFLHIPVAFDVTKLNNSQINHVVGIDRGLRFIATCYDEKGKTLFVNGKKVLETRRKYKKLRAELQAKGTKSAKKRLKKIGQRENRWMTDVNHRLSKTLVNHYGKNTLFVLEDLTSVTFDTTKNRRKDNRYEHSSWAFYQLEQFLAYKAQLKHSKVIEVSAQYTSQRCPKCGRINKENRNYSLHLYRCDRCGYSSNDDRIASMNIQYLGTEYVTGNPKPRFISK